MPPPDTVSRAARGAISLLLLAAAAGCGASGARFALLEENDVFNLGKGYDIDRDYTQGFRLAATLPEADTPGWAKSTAEWLPIFGRGAPTHTGFLVGQEIYTPEDRNAVVPDPDDRPYAAWAFAGMAIQAPVLDADAARRRDRLDTLELDLGVVGPSAQGESAQNRVHEIFGISPAQGWHAQLGGEPAVQLGWDRRWRLIAGEFGSPGGFGWDVVPRTVLRLGTVHIDGTVGGVARFGWNLPRDFGPLAVDATGLRKDAAPAEPWILFHAGGDIRGVVHNLFLEGGTFEEGPRVTPTNAVWSGTAAFSAGWGAFSVHFGQTWVSPQFRETRRHHQYATILLSATCWF